MRLWHKDLITVLPRQQLLSQWRECCAIAKTIMAKGTPNHMLVNRIMNYNKSHFYAYCCMICNEMFRRGYSISDKSRQIILDYVDEEERQVSSRIEKDGSLFYGWHNKRYLIQCFHNLQEKYDCGRVPQNEYENVCKRMAEITKTNVKEWL